MAFMALASLWLLLVVFFLFLVLIKDFWSDPMINSFFTGLLQSTESDKVQTIALVCMAIGLLFWLGCKVYEAIIKYKHEQQKKKDASVELSFNPCVYVIYHVPTLSAVKAFVSENECIEYFNKHCRHTDGYDWMCIDVRPYIEE